MGIEVIDLLIISLWVWGMPAPNIILAFLKIIQVMYIYTCYYFSEYKAMTLPYPLHKHNKKSPPLTIANPFCPL